MASMFGTFVQKGIGVIAATGKLIVAKGEQLLTLDFSDQSGKVKKAQDDLDQAYADLEADFESAKKILTAPLGDYPVGSLSDDDGGDGDSNSNVNVCVSPVQCTRG